jgi:hypothetical protein
VKQRLWLIAILAGVGVAAVLPVLRPGTISSPSAAPTATPAVVVPADPIAWEAVAWQKVPNPFPKGDPHPLRIDGLTAGDGVLVGWGRVAAPDRNQFNDMGAVFISTDAMHWRAIALDDGVAATDTSEPHGVVVGPLGMLAFGDVCCGTEEQALWRSIDGLHWTRSPLKGGFDQQSDSVQRAIGLKAGWVAVGAQGQLAAIWTSSDGVDWKVVAGLGKGIVSDVARTPGGVIAVGTIDDVAGTHDGAIWASKDGIQWARVAATDPALIGRDETELSQVVPFAGGLFVVGNFGTHQERVKCEQLIGMASVGAAPPPDTALSCGWGREHHWLSPDGSSWVRLPPLDPLPGQPPNPGRRPIEFRLLAAGGPGLVLLGEDSLPPDGDARIWVSMDGNAWQPLDAPFPGTGNPQAGMVVVGRQIVAVGDPIGGGEGIGVAIGTIP